MNPVPMKKTRKLAIVTRGDDGLAVRSYAEVARELERRHGWKLSRVRIQQLCARAEQKLRERLKTLSPR